jgi:hypothetical protein
MRSYTDILFQLLLSWPEQSYAVKALAARYYVGADTEADLRRIASHEFGWGRKPPLTNSEVDAIISQRELYGNPSNPA